MIRWLKASAPGAQWPAWNRSARESVAVLLKASGALLAASLAWGAMAQALVLVTEEEAVASRSAGAVLVPRTVPQPGAPRIQFVAPDISRPIIAPTPIEVRFVVDPPAELKPESFRVLYGVLRVDVTARLLGAARITREGISVKEATLPSGRHQLLLSVADSLGRETLQWVSFTVQ